MKATLEIQNLKCGGCANTITKKVSEVENISQLEVNNDNNTVSFKYESDDALEKVKTVLNQIGYPVVGEKNALTTKAKSFVSCAIGRINS
ncbi:Copper chaperone CopZ [Hyunsoonleella jejuensis]|uniref:Copper chaperone CopZ n=1 Tax=Hyunsoonleella jejuensis TaxID=419940 RepID=A0A1H9JLI5_9FLAO|nr:heavy-metal-associated domain-containing protein [Hyunsoonleella jejuensis]SEQ87633.1 Copper chaperone CopZ [Hyunsoonleella jejuensis]